MFELKDLLQTISTLIAATSVFYAVRAFHRARLTQQIGSLRTVLGESLRNVNDLDMIMSEGETNKLGIAISKECTRIFGTDITPEQLGDELSKEENYNLLVQAVHEGFDQSNIARKLDEGRHYFDNLEVQLKPLAPSSANIVNAISRYTISLLWSTFATGHVKQVFSHSENRKSLREEISKSRSISIAYAELANAFAEPSSYYITNYGQKQFDHIRAFHDTVVIRLMEMTDSQLIDFFAKDKNLNIQSSKSKGVKSLVDYLSKSAGDYGKILTNADRDILIRSATQIEATLSSNSNIASD